MRRTIVSLLCGAALITAMVPAGLMAAKAGKHPAKVRGSELRLRIKDGVKSGELSHPAAKQLRTELKGFRAEVKAAKANGKISPEDRARLKAERNRLNDEINAQERNPK